jgi:hypothetical protein
MTMIDLADEFGRWAKARGPLKRSAVPAAIEPLRNSRRVRGSTGDPYRALSLA